MRAIFRLSSICAEQISKIPLPTDSSVDIDCKKIGERQNLNVYRRLLAPNYIDHFNKVCANLF